MACSLEPGPRPAPCSVVRLEKGTISSIIERMIVEAGNAEFLRRISQDAPRAVTRRCHGKTGSARCRLGRPIVRLPKGARQLCRDGPDSLFRCRWMRHVIEKIAEFVACRSECENATAARECIDLRDFANRRSCWAEDGMPCFGQRDTIILG